MEEIVKVIIVDDSKIFRDGITSVLNDVPNITVVGGASNGLELLDQLKTIKPDIILLDSEMPRMNGDQTLEILNKQFPAIKTIMVSMFFDTILIDSFKRKGAWGFVPKGCSDEKIEKTIISVYNGLMIFNIDVASDLLLKQQVKCKRTFHNIDQLSEREIEIMDLICLCKSNKQIASILSITERTVEFHKTNIYKKTKCVSGPDLVLYSIKNGLMVL
jgi:two-component system nitrate/nitrite response regulator NarL